MNIESIAKVGTQHITLSERVYRELRSAIIYRHILPGQQLRSEDLSRRLGVSRTPVKEALSRLRVEGLVDYTERHGFTVVNVSQNDLPEIFEAQLMVVSNAVETGLATASEEEIAEIRKAAEEVVAARDLDPPDCQVMYDADSSFHRAIVGLGHNQCAMDWYCQLDAAIQGIRLSFIAGRTDVNQKNPRAEHAAIMDALERRDVAQALAALELHCERKLARVLAHLAHLT
ncbi:MAG: GntR family transcriptional regulator [Chloroflexi bacterium]|nr:GntR family transcriptional regulator [Chloroflexota bacterium]